MKRALLLLVLSMSCSDGKDTMLPPAFDQPVQAIEIRSYKTRQILWKVVAGQPRDVAKRVMYGRTPTHFVQVVPERGAPPSPLTRGERVWIRVESGTAWIESDCSVQSLASFRCGYYRAGPVGKS